MVGSSFEGPKIYQKKVSHVSAHKIFVSLTVAPISKANTCNCFDKQFPGVGSSFKVQKKKKGQ